MNFAIFHNGIFIAIISHSLIGVSLVWDKVLLKRPETKNLLSYVFWLGFISIFGLALIPFGFHMPNHAIAALAFWAGVIHLVANYFYYAALNSGEASDTLAIMGGFTPLATALIAIPLLKHPLGQGMLLGFMLMVGGGFIMFGAERFNFRRILPNVLAAASTFGLVNVLEKVVFEHTNFVSGYVFFTLGTFAGALALLIPRSWRRQIFTSSENAEPRNRFWYFVNRFLSGVGSFLLFYAVSLTSPAIVSAITGLRYVIIFVGAYSITRLKPSWLQENFARPILIAKAAATALIVAGLCVVGTRTGSQTEESSELPRSTPTTAAAGLRPPQLNPLPPTGVRLHLREEYILRATSQADNWSP